MAFKSRIGKFSKIGRSSKSPLILVAFAVLFAGVGSYLIINSKAGTAGSFFVSTTLDGNLTSGFRIQIKNVGSPGGCDSNIAPGEYWWTNNEWYGNTNPIPATDTGLLVYNCDTGSNNIKTYEVTNAKAYTPSNVNVASIQIKNSLTNQWQNLGSPPRFDIRQPASTYIRINYTSIPATPTPIPATFPTELTVRKTTVPYNTATSYYWQSSGASACTVYKYSDTSYTNQVGSQIVAASGPQEITTGNLTSSTGFRVRCQGTNGGAAGWSRGQYVTVDKSCPSGYTGSQPDCKQIGCTSNCTPPPTPVCPAGYTGTPPRCVKTVTTTNTRVVTRTVNTGVASNSADKERPTTPTNFTGEQLGGSEVSLSWDASTDNLGIAGYTLERTSDQKEWTMLDDAIIDTSYSDMTAEYNTAYTYRLSAKDNSGNFSDYVLADITTNEFEANVKADEESTITSEDGIVEVTFPAGALSEDAFCDISKDSTSQTPKGYKLVAGGYTINCRNKAGDTIDSFDKELKVTMHLKSFAKKYDEFAAYAVGDSLSSIPASFNSSTGDLTFNLKELQTFAAYGSKKGSMWWIWVLLVLLLVGIFFLIRRLRSGGGNDDYYDTTDYVSMPPSAPVSPLDTGANGYQHHPSLPEMVSQGGQPQYPPQPPQQQPGPGQQPPYPPQQPPLPPQ